MELRFNLRRRKGRIRQEVEIYRETIVAKGQTPVVTGIGLVANFLSLVMMYVARPACAVAICMASSKSSLRYAKASLASADPTDGIT